MNKETFEALNKVTRKAWSNVAFDDNKMMEALGLVRDWMVEQQEANAELPHLVD